MFKSVAAWPLATNRYELYLSNEVHTKYSSWSEGCEKIRCQGAVKILEVKFGGWKKIYQLGRNPY